MWTADIDVGGTLTDGLFTSDDTLVSVKVDTTPHDLTVCLFECLGQAAARLEFPDVAAFLENVELIRWSTTITSNVLAEHHGPRIGLLVSKGHERNLYGSEAHSSMLGQLLSQGDVIGVNGSSSEAAIVNAARVLLESGVRRICVSLAGAHRDARRELELKRTIGQQYPDHFLGSVPVLAGSDISKVSDDRTRTYCAVVNAYTHGALAATLFKAEDELRETGRYTGTFLVSHINGGVAGIAKTRAIDTIESGPVLGIFGSAYVAKAQGLRDVIAMDIGGTTAKVSVLSGGEPIYKKPSDFFGIPMELSLPDLRSIALGGGSVVKPLPSGRKGPSVQLGPESMGSYPGPACYSLGGDQPTLTDAFVSAGLINPHYFLGGAKPIDRDLAEKAMEASVAQPLHLSVADACQQIIGHAFDLVAGMISRAQSELQRDLSKHTLFAYGGNGGLFACGVAERAGLKSVQIFSLGPVFSAFGSSVSDISHMYERSIPEPTISEAGVAAIREMLEEMKREGTQDLLGEGIRPENVSYAVEFEVSGKGSHAVSVACPESALRSARELDAALRAGVGLPRGPMGLDLIRLRVRKEMPKLRLPERASQDADPTSARVGTRHVLWGSRSGEAHIYRWEELRPGNRVEGCAVLEGANTTYFIPDGWVMVMDGYGNGSLSRG